MSRGAGGDRLGLPAPAGTVANHWLNAVRLASLAEREAFWRETNAKCVMSRLAMYADCQHDGLANAIRLEERVVNLPSSVPDGALARWAN
jgi:hypothetical protein